MKPGKSFSDSFLVLPKLKLILDFCTPAFKYADKRSSFSNGKVDSLLEKDTLSGRFMLE
jgi:hypothetical protein